MRDDYYSRPADRGTQDDRGDFRDRGHDFEERREGYSSRQDYSRSPTRQNMNDDDRGRRDAYHPDNGSTGRGGRDRYRGDDASYSRGQRYRDVAHDHDYSQMYDDGRDPDPDNRSRRYDDGGQDDDGYYGRQRQDRGDYSYRSRSGNRYSPSRSRSPRHDAGRPSDTIILEGLPFGVPANELQESIRMSSIAADLPSVDMRLSASRGHCRAFIQFQSVDDAVDFVREHFPTLRVRLPYPTDEVPDGQFEAFLHYARGRDEGDTRGPNRGGNWTCPTCDYDNYPTRNRCKTCGGPQPGPSDWKQSLTGVADAAESPSQILVVYPIQAFVTEEMLANEMKRLELEKPPTVKETTGDAPKLKSTAPSGDGSGFGARPGSLHRVFLMRDTMNDEPLKYGFAEFWTMEDAAAAMAKFRFSRSFTVAACAVTVSTIHMGVFLPEDRQLTADLERMSFNPLFNPELRVRYRDRRAYPSQFIVNANPPEADKSTRPTNEDVNGNKKTKKRKADASIGSSSAKKAVPMAGQMAMWQRKHDELVAPGRGASATTSPERDSEKGIAGASHPPKPDPNAPIKISLGATKLGSPSPQGLGPGGVPSPPRSAGGTSESAAGEHKAESYVDHDRLMCLICMRKYKSAEEVKIHEKSRNHKTAMETEDLVKAALPRLAARDKRLQKQAEESGEHSDPAAPQYRDRAKERRNVFNQPKKAATQQSKPSSDSGKPAKQAETATPPASTGLPKPSKGAGMLAKMGWTSGAGLGANADGRTEVIATNAYQEGVGLGAEGSNLGDAAELAERKTTNKYSDYVSSMQDKARERYSKLE